MSEYPLEITTLWCGEPPSDFEAPPSGRLLRVRYDNGDYMRIEFHEFRKLESAIKKLSSIGSDFLRSLPQQWPMTFVTVTMKAGETEYYFAPSEARLPRQNVFKIFASNGKVGLRINQ